ncbi:hypothetical protein SDD30_00660 [Moorella naiadis]|uniref:hypothetical protein n=1 Tax=Moorella naiadis (nom. illeg.) TaxID=3093670 RepID=UPI003D9CB8B0
MLYRDLLSQFAVRYTKEFCSPRFRDHTLRQGLSHHAVETMANFGGKLFSRLRFVDIMRCQWMHFGYWLSQR